MGRDERCALSSLYGGESRHTLGTTDAHEMYLEPPPEGFSRQAALRSQAPHPLQLLKRVSVREETVHGNHALFQAVLHFKLARTVHLADLFLQQAFCAVGLTVRQSMKYQTHGLVR